MKKKIERTSDYCKKCKVRAKVNPVDKNSPEIGVNVPGFCSIGYTQNPRTESKTFNTAKNNGVFSICPRNPWRLKALIRMGMADPVANIQRIGG